MSGEHDTSTNGAADANGKSHASAEEPKTSVEEPPKRRRVMAGNASGAASEVTTIAPATSGPADLFSPPSPTPAATTPKPASAPRKRSTPAARAKPTEAPADRSPAPEPAEAAAPPAPAASTTASAAAPAQAGIFAILLPGTVIGFPTRVYGLLPIRHVGIISDELGPDGKPKILHASNIYSAVVETTWSDFLWKAIAAPTLDGYPSEIPSAGVIARAKSRLGRPYHVTEYNCEIFVADCHDMKLESPQWAAWKNRALSVTPDPWGRTRTGSSFFR